MSKLVLLLVLLAQQETNEAFVLPQQSPLSRQQFSFSSCSVARLADVSVPSNEGESASSGGRRGVGRKQGFLASLLGPFGVGSTQQQQEEQLQQQQQKKVIRSTTSATSTTVPFMSWWGTLTAGASSNTESATTAVPTGSGRVSEQQQSASPSSTTSSSSFSWGSITNFAAVRMMTKTKTMTTSTSTTTTTSTSSSSSSSSFTKSTTGGSGNGVPPKPLITQGDWGSFLDDVTGLIYYFNMRTGESRWTPPSVMFPRVDVSPKPLISSGDWSAYYDNQGTGLVYYFNRRTGESTWEKPFASFPASTLTVLEKSKEQQIMRKLGESGSSNNSIEREPVLQPIVVKGYWAAYRDVEQTNEVYYYNSKTGESSWDKPEGFPLVAPDVNPIDEGAREVVGSAGRSERRRKSFAVKDPEPENVAGNQWGFLSSLLESGNTKQQAQQKEKSEGEDWWKGLISAMVDTNKQAETRKSEKEDWWKGLISAIVDTKTQAEIKDAKQDQQNQQPLAGLSFPSLEWPSIGSLMPQFTPIEGTVINGAGTAGADAKVSSSYTMVTSWADKIVRAQQQGATRVSALLDSAAELAIELGDLASFTQSGRSKTVLIRGSTKPTSRTINVVGVAVKDAEENSKRLLSQGGNTPASVSNFFPVITINKSVTMSVSPKKTSSTSRTIPISSTTALAAAKTASIPSTASSAIATAPGLVNWRQNSNGGITGTLVARSGKYDRGEEITTSPLRQGAGTIRPGVIIQTTTGDRYLLL